MCIRNLYFLKKEGRNDWHGRLHTASDGSVAWYLPKVTRKKIQHTREDRAGTRKSGCSIASRRRRMNAPSHHSPDFFSRTGIIALNSFKLMLLGFGCLRSKTILTDPLSSKWGNKKKNLKSLLNYSAPICTQMKTFNYVSRQFWASHVCVFLLLSLEVFKCPVQRDWRLLSWFHCCGC